MITIALAALYFLILPEKAYAYIDLGAGSYIFQIAIAFIIGGLFSIKMYWRKIILSIANFLSGKKKENKQ